jgi:hypothetical protein
METLALGRYFGDAAVDSLLWFLRAFEVSLHQRHALIQAPMRSVIAPHHWAVDLLMMLPAEICVSEVRARSSCRCFLHPAYRGSELSRRIRRLTPRSPNR